jgi:hypothetical protein
MRLYVWEKVLTDWSDGMIVAVAPDLETALRLAESSYDRGEMGRVEPTVIEFNDPGEPRIWRVHGGG